MNLLAIHRVFTIYMGKPVGPRFGQMVRKSLDWGNSAQNRVYHLYKSVPFTENDREGLKLVSV